MTPKERDQITQSLHQSIKNLEAKHPQLRELHDHLDRTIDDNDTPVEQKLQNLLELTHRIRLSMIAANN